MGVVNYSVRDLYPTMGLSETSTDVIPEVDDMDALNEDVKTAGDANNHYARGKNILIAVGVFVALIIFMGGRR